MVSTHKVGSSNLSGDAIKGLDSWILNYQVGFVVVKLYLRFNMKNKCLCCGLETTNQKFCSRLCSNKKQAQFCRNGKHNWADVQRAHNAGSTKRELCRDFHISEKVLYDALKNGFLIARKLPRKPMSEDAKKKLSASRKLWLSKNPERHPWRKSDKFKSVPCSVLKDFLREHGLSFVEEYIPIPERFFSLDIAFPDQKIAIEVNGQQHYASDGKLKPYYQSRHNTIEGAGWRLIELHYSMVYNRDFLVRLSEDLRLSSVDYSSYVYEQAQIREKRVQTHHQMERKGICVKCGSQTVTIAKSGMCRSCLSVSKRKVERPTCDQLSSDIQVMPWVAIGRKYGVSDNAVRKWAFKYGLTTV